MQIGSGLTEFQGKAVADLKATLPAWRATRVDPIR